MVRDPVYPKCMNALQQVKARHGRPILICNRDDKDTQDHAYQFLDLPHEVDCLQGILTVIPMQLLSFHIARLRGYDGQPVVITEVGDTETHKMVKQHLDVPAMVDCLQGLVTVIPMQLLSLHIAERRNLDVDCPRNLAKSVTVE